MKRTQKWHLSFQVSLNFIDCSDDLIIQACKRFQYNRRFSKTEYSVVIFHITTMQPDTLCK